MKQYIFFFQIFLLLGVNYFSFNLWFFSNFGIGTIFQAGDGNKKEQLCF